MSLCKFCRKTGLPVNFRPDASRLARDQSDIRTVYHSSFPALEYSSRNCHLCRLYLDQIDRRGELNYLEERVRNGDYTTAVILDFIQSGSDWNTRHLEISTSRTVILTNKLATCTEKSG